MGENSAGPDVGAFRVGDLALYGDVLHGLEEGIAVLDEDRRVLVCNDAIYRILGLDPQSGPPTRASIDFEWLDSGRFPNERTPFEVTKRSGEALSGEIVLARLPDGSTRWLSNSTREVHNGDGGRAFVVSSIDVTGPRLIVDALQEINEGYRLLAEYVGDLVARCDDNGHFLLCHTVGPGRSGVRGRSVHGQTPAMTSSVSHRATGPMKHWVRCSRERNLRLGLPASPRRGRFGGLAGGGGSSLEASPLGGAGSPDNRRGTGGSGCDRASAHGKSLAGCRRSVAQRFRTRTGLGMTMLNSPSPRGWWMSPFGRIGPARRSSGGRWPAVPL